MNEIEAFEIWDDHNYLWEPMIEQFKEEFAKHERPFLLCDIINMNENAHTNLLTRILNYDHHKFLSSFVEEVLGLQPVPPLQGATGVTVTTQKMALGQKIASWGLIDLYIEIGNKQIVIENKVNKAGDTRNQLSRYAATMLAMGTGLSPYHKKDNDFEKNWCDKANKGQKKQIDKRMKTAYIYYLTLNDNDAEPSTASISGNLRKQLLSIGHLRHISYEGEIYQWLKERVLPLIPQEKDGLMIGTVQQYIAYLEFLLASATGWEKSWFTSEDRVGGDALYKYQELTKGMENYKHDTKDPIVRSFIKTLDFAREDVFAHDIEQYLSKPAIPEADKELKDWRIHYTPSFIVLYKQKWAERDERNYSIPSIHITIRNPFHLASKKRRFNYQLGVDHVSPNVSEMSHKDMTHFPDKVYEGLKDVFAKTDQSLKRENHGKYLLVSSYDTNPQNDEVQTTMDFNVLENRIAVYKDAINRLDKEIQMMDTLVAVIKK